MIFDEKKRLFFLIFYILLWYYNSVVSTTSRRGGMADACDSKSHGKPCGFDSHRRHQNHLRNQVVFLCPKTFWKYVSATPPVYNMIIQENLPKISGGLFLLLFIFDFAQNHLCTVDLIRDSSVFILDSPDVRSNFVSNIHLTGFVITNFDLEVDQL